MAQPTYRSRVAQVLNLGDKLHGLAQRLREGGLTERAVQVCFGVQCVGHAPLRTASMTPPDSPPLAAVLPWLFVANKPLPVEAVRACLGDESYELFRDADVLREQSVFVWAEVCVMPVGEALSVSDCIGRRDAPMPDDSAFHLINTLPTRRLDRWLDIGTGNAIAPLARRDLAKQVLGTDVNDAALEFAALGVALSSATEIELTHANVFDGVRDKQWNLITFNAPIPRPYDGLLERFWREAADYLAPHGEVLVHCQQQPKGYIEALDLPGAVCVARYTPAESRQAFGITRWCPDAPSHRELRQVELTPQCPHVTRDALQW